MINKKKFLVIGIVFLLSLVIFSSFLNNSNALQNDTDLKATLHAHLDSTSAEIDSDMMELGTYSYFQMPDLDVGTYSHDLTRIDISNILYPNANTTALQTFINEIQNQGNSSVLYSSFPAYYISTGYDTRIELFLNYSSDNYTKVELFHDTIDSLNWNLYNNTNKVILYDDIVDQDSDVYEYYPTTNYGSSNVLQIRNPEGSRRYVFIKNNGYDNKYLIQNLTKTKPDLKIYNSWFFSTSVGVKLYKTSNFDESTINWNNQPALGSQVTSFTINHNGWYYIELYDMNYNYYEIRNPNSNNNFYSTESSGYEPSFLYYISKEYQGSGYKYIQTNKTETLQLRSPVYSNKTRLSDGDYLNFSIQTTTTKEVRIKLLYNGSTVQDSVLLPAGNSNFNVQTRQIIATSDLTFDQIEIYGEFDDAKYLKLYDVIVEGWSPSDFINNVYFNNFHYQILGIDKNETLTLTRYNRTINFQENDGVYQYYYVDSNNFSYYYYNTSLVVPLQDVNVTIGLNQELSLNISIYFEYSLLQSKLPSEVNLQINGVDAIDSTYNSGYVLLTSFPITLLITADLPIIYRLTTSSDFSFSFDLSVISHTYLRKDFELLSNHLIYFERIDLPDFDIKKIYLNSIDLGYSNPNYLSPEVLMNYGNLYSLDVILADNIYQNLPYFYDYLGTGLYTFKLIGTSNVVNFNDVNQYSNYNVPIPSGFSADYADLNFSDLQYTPYYDSNSSYNTNSIYSESQSYPDEQVSWDPSYYLTPANGTKLGEYDNNYTYLNTYSPTSSQFTLINGSKIYYGDMNTLNGNYSNFRSTQQNASGIPTTYVYLNGSFVSTGSLWSVDNSYSNFKSNQQNSSCVPTSYTFLNGSLVSTGSLWSMNGAYTNLKSKAGVTGGAQDTGYLTAGTVVEDSSFGTATWDNEDNAKTSNNAYATSVAVYSADSHYLVASNFGAVIPAGSTVNGIIAQIERKAGTASKVTDIVVSLMKDGVIGGDNKKEANYWATSDETITYGALNDLWGLSWSPAQINSANFGIALSYEGSSFYTGTQSIDVMTLKIYYTPVGSQATLNATSTLQINKPKDSKIESVRLNYAQKINATITAGTRALYMWNYVTSAWVAVNTTISTANYYEMVYTMTSQHYSSTNQVQLKWIITRTDAITAFSLYIDKMVVRMNYTCALNFTSTLQIVKPKNSVIENVRLTYAQKTNRTCTTKAFYIWSYTRSAWDVVNSSISSSAFYSMIFSLNSSHYDSSYNTILKWVIYRATSLMTKPNDMFSLYIDKMVINYNYSCVLNFTTSFQFSMNLMEKVNSLKINYAQKSNRTCTTKSMYVWNYDRSAYDLINSTISSTNYYDIQFVLNSSHYDGSYNVLFKWILYRASSLMTKPNDMFSLYIDKFLLTVNTTIDDDAFDTVSAIWINDDIVYAHQPIVVYWKAFDDSPTNVIVSNKVNLGTSINIFTIAIINNTIQSKSWINETSGFYFLNLTFYDNDSNWEKWSLNFTLHSSVSINLAYQNPIYINELNNVSVYIKATTQITSIHYDNSTAYLLKSASYPLTELNFTFLVVHSSAQVFDVSVLVITSLLDKWWVNVTDLACLKNAVYIDFNNLYDRYYQMDTLNVSVYFRNIYNNPISKVIQFSVDYQDGTNVMNGGVLSNAGTISALLDYNFDAGFYHLNLSSVGSAIYIDTWKMTSFELFPSQRAVNSTDISLTVNGNNVLNNYIRINDTFNFILNHLNNASFDLALQYQLNHTITNSFIDFISYTETFVATTIISSITITDANISGVPLNFTQLYINDAYTTNYVIFNSRIQLNDLIGDVLVSNDFVKIDVRSNLANLPRRNQLTSNPTSEDTSILFEEYLYANETFEYWYFVNSFDINSVSLNHTRTATIISTFTINGSMYYFDEDSNYGDIFVLTEDINPNFINTIYSWTTTGVTSDLTIKYKADLDVSDVDMIVDLSIINLWMDNWSNGAVENSNDLKLTVPHINFTNTYQTLTLHGISSVPSCSFASFEPQDIVSIDGTDRDYTYYGFVEYSTYSQYWLLNGIESDWTLDGVHYGYITMTINKNTGYFRCSGFDDSITESYLKFDANPINQYYVKNNTVGAITINIDCNLPVEMALVYFSIPSANKYKFTSNQNLTFITTLSGEDYYMLMVEAGLRTGHNEIEITYTVYSITNVWVLILLMVVLSVAVVVFYWYMKRKSIKKDVEAMNPRERRKYYREMMEKGGILTQGWRYVKDLFRKKTKRELGQLEKLEKQEKLEKEIEQPRVFY